MMAIIESPVKFLLKRITLECYKVHFSNSFNPEQTGPLGSTEFANGTGKFLGTLCFYQMSTNIFLIWYLWGKYLAKIIDPMISYQMCANTVII